MNKRILCYNQRYDQFKLSQLQKVQKKNNEKDRSRIFTPSNK